MQTVDIGIRHVSECAITPTYGTSQAACFDLYACIKDRASLVVLNLNNEKMNVPVVKCQKAEGLDVVQSHSLLLRPHERMLVPTGIVFDIPEGYSMRLHGRSGLAYKFDVCLANSEGIIDSDFTEQTQIMIKNNSDQSFIFNHGDRICQAEIVPVIKTTFSLLDHDVDLKGDRDGGFGHTGA